MHAFALIPVLLLAPAAWAGAPSGDDLAAWSDTSVELQPDLYGKTGARAMERLGAEVSYPDGWTLSADAALRALRSPYDPVMLDVYRLSATQKGLDYRLSLGRQVRLDARGFERLDGATVDITTPTVFTGSLWGGRLWHPGVWSKATTMVFGGQVNFHPAVGGTPTPLTRFALGYEGRAYDAGFASRLHFAASSRTVRGLRGAAFVEVEPRGADTGVRASLGGTVPAGRRLDLGLQARWEGLRPDTAAEDLRTPIDWLAPDGYGIGTVRAQWHQGPWSFAAYGGPSLRPVQTTGGVSVGGIGRGGLSWTDQEHITIGVFGSGAGVDGSWIGGGGGEFTWSSKGLDATADVGLYQFQGIDGHAAPIWEGRVHGRVPLWTGERNGHAHHLALGIDGAAGTDRQLAAWVRGGVSLQAWIGRGR